MRVEVTVEMNRAFLLFVSKKKKESRNLLTETRLRKSRKPIKDFHRHIYNGDARHCFQRQNNNNHNGAVSPFIKRRTKFRAGMQEDKRCGSTTFRDSSFFSFHICACMCVYVYSFVAVQAKRKKENKKKAAQLLLLLFLIFSPSSPQKKSRGLS